MSTLTIVLISIGGAVACFGLLLGMCELLDRMEEAIRGYRGHRSGRGRR